MKAIVDTNVGVVANGNAEQAPASCVIACAKKLEDLQKGGTVVIDDNWFVLREYMRQLHSSGQPGSGDAFPNWILTNQANPTRCEQIHLDHWPRHEAAGEGDEPEFAAFPGDEALARFDPSDRKFVALSLVHPEHPPIWNAVDTDYWDHRDALIRNGVALDFLCPEAMGIAKGYRPQVVRELTVDYPLVEEI